jgi:hypothetical protein
MLNCPFQSIRIEWRFWNATNVQQPLIKLAIFGGHHRFRFFGVAKCIVPL